MDGSSGSIYGPGNDNLAGQNQNFNSLSGQNFSALNGAAPVVSQQTQALTGQATSNPYAAGAQTGANAAGAYGTNTLTPQLQQGATALAGLGDTNASYVPQALQTGFDPQNGLYNRNFQQNQDQTNAVSAMNGVAGTPYAAGVANQSNQNFNMDWQNQQLARQATAAGTAGTLTNNANTGYNGASTVGNSAMTTGAASAALPSSVFNANIMSQLQALISGNTAVGGATGNNDAAMSQILQYLGYGTNATTAQQKESDANSPLAALGALAGVNTGGGGTAGGDALAFLGL